MNHMAIGGNWFDQACQAQLPEPSDPVDRRLLLRAILAHRLIGPGLLVGTYLKFSLRPGFGV
jgi:hypothetical protein